MLEMIVQHEITDLNPAMRDERSRLYAEDQLAPKAPTIKLTNKCHRSAETAIGSGLDQAAVAKGGRRLRHAKFGILAFSRQRESLVP